MTTVAGRVPQPPRVSLPTDVWVPEEADQAAHASPRQLAWRRFRRNRLALVAVGVIVVLAVIAILAPLIAPYDPLKPVTPPAYGKPPSLAHPFGTDGSGRDVLSRIMYGSRVSLSVGIVAVSIYLTIGIILGSISGYRRGLVDALIMRATDTVMSFPALIIILAIIPILGPSIFNIMLVIGLLGWPPVARLVRGEFLSLREREFTLAARGIGAPTTGGSSSATSCPTSPGRSSSSPASAWPTRSSRRPASASWALASSRRTPAGATCSTPRSTSARSCREAVALDRARRDDRDHGPLDQLHRRRVARRPGPARWSEQALMVTAARHAHHESGRRRRQPRHAARATPSRRRPRGPLSDPRGHDLRRQRRQLRAPGRRDAGPRRRVGLRQERHQPRDHPAAAAARRPDRARLASGSAAGTCWRSRRPSSGKVRGEEIAMVFQDPLTSLNPVLTIGTQLTEGMLVHEKISGARRRTRGRSSCSRWSASRTGGTG